MAHRVSTRIIRVVLAAALAFTGLLWSPMAARACACGAVVTANGGAVSGETGIVQWDGTTEQIDMVLSMETGAADAAWIMPTPRGAELGLGERAHFTTLAKLSEPRVERRPDFRLRVGRGRDGARAGAPPTGAPPVTVEAVTEVGPFRVTTLSGSSASAVTTWLTDQGYPAKPQIIGVLDEYLSDGWVIQAVKLTPASGGVLPKDLTPLRITFDTDSPVYPIKLSSQATQRQWVTLYLIGPKALTVEGQGRPQSPLRLLFAGPVPAASVGREGEDLWLTTVSGRMSPADLTQDFSITVDEQATPYHQVVTRPVRWGEQLVNTSIAVVVIGVLLSVLVGGVALIVVVSRGPGPKI